MWIKSVINSPGFYSCEMIEKKTAPMIVSRKENVKQQPIDFLKTAVVSIIGSEMLFN